MFVNHIEQLMTLAVVEMNAPSTGNENFYLKAFFEETRGSLQRSFSSGIQKTWLKQTKIYILGVNFKIRSYAYFLEMKCHDTV